jgi:hypothetical protein
MRTRSQETSRIWKQRYERYRNGGLSRRAFCQRFKLKLSTLDYWFARVRHEGGGQELVELKGIAGDSAGTSSLTLVTAEGIRLEISLGCDMGLLAEVVRLLGSRA